MVLAQNVTPPLIHFSQASLWEEYRRQNAYNCKPNPGSNHATPICPADRKPCALSTPPNPHSASGHLPRNVLLMCSSVTSRPTFLNSSFFRLIKKKSNTQLQEVCRCGLQVMSCSISCVAWHPRLLSLKSGRWILPTSFEMKPNRSRRLAGSLRNLQEQPIPKPSSPNK